MDGCPTTVWCGSNVPELKNRVPARARSHVHGRCAWKVHGNNTRSGVAVSALGRSLSRNQQEWLETACVEAGRPGRRHFRFRALSSKVS